MDQFPETVDGIRELLSQVPGFGFREEEAGFASEPMRGTDDHDEEQNGEG
jgi:hypothetical protein